jgi:hypothetical protein
MTEYSTLHLTEIPHASRALPRRRRAATRRVKTAVVYLHAWSLLWHQAIDAPLWIARACPECCLPWIVCTCGEEG